MRIKSIDLVRYGHFSDYKFKIPKKDKDLHILYGLNEAGKSTTLSAIEDFLFGIPNMSTYNFKHSNTSMRIGASIENERLSLKAFRKKGNKNTLLDKNDQLIVNGDEILKSLLVGINRPTYEQMFCLDHDRLKQGGKEILDAKDEVGEMLFEAGSGMSGIRKKLRTLKNEADILWTPKRLKNKKYYQLTNELKEMEKEIRNKSVSINQWSELKKQYDNADEEYKILTEAYENKTKEYQKVNRIRRVYPIIKEINEIEKKINDLGKVVPLSKDSKELVEKTELNQRSLSAQILTHENNLKQLRDDISHMNLDNKLLLREKDIIQLNELRIEVRSEKNDLPKRHSELENEKRYLFEVAKSLGWKDKEISKLIGKIPTPSKIAYARSLLNKQGALETSYNNKKNALENAVEEQNTIKTNLKNVEDYVNISKLKSIIKQNKERGDISSSIKNTQNEIESIKNKIDRIVEKFNPSITPKELQTVTQLPTKHEIVIFRDIFQDKNNSTSDIRRDIKKIEDEIQRLKNQSNQLMSDETLITENKLKEILEHRDSLWIFIRRIYIENQQVTEEELQLYDTTNNKLISKYEEMINNVDEIFRQRFEKADIAGTLKKIDQDINSSEFDLNIRNTDLEEVAKKIIEVNDNWEDLWKELPFKPLMPDFMLDWLDNHVEYNSLIEELDDESDKLKYLLQDEAEMKDGLLKELGAIGINIESLKNNQLYEIIDFASEEIQKSEIKKEKKSDLKVKLETSKNNIKNIQNELNDAKDKWTAWQNAWDKLLNEIGLSSDLHIDEIIIQIDQFEDMRNCASKIEDLTYNRIDKINKDIANFDQNTKDVVVTIAEDLSEMNADEAVLELNNRLKISKETHNLIEQKKNLITATEEKKNEIQLELLSEQETINHLKEIVSTDSIEELKKAIIKSDTLRELEIGLFQFKDKLKKDGDHISFDELKKECEDYEIDKIPAHLEEIDIELNDLREQRDVAIENRTYAKNKFESIGGHNDAAIARSTRQEILAEIKNVTNQYIELQTCITLLQWTIDRFLQQKQGPLLNSASEIFSKLTDESFIGLKIHYDDKDQPYLIANKSDGDVKTVDGLSDATRDQLYLALRIAYLRNFIDQKKALPFILDDLFINFDNVRASAGLRVLSELSEKTQVLFFTHHEHLVEIAKQELGNEISTIQLHP